MQLLQALECSPNQMEMANSPHGPWFPLDPKQPLRFTRVRPASVWDMHVRAWLDETGLTSSPALHK